MAMQRRPERLDVLPARQAQTSSIHPQDTIGYELVRGLFKTSQEVGFQLSGW